MSSESELRRDIARVQRKASELEQKFLARKREIVHGMLTQDLAVAKLCIAAGVDPRSSVRVAITPSGELLASSNRSEDLLAVLNAAKAATVESRPLQIQWEPHPAGPERDELASLDDIEPPALPPPNGGASRASPETKTEE